MADATRDGNSVATLLAASNVDGITPVRIYADPVTHRLLVDTSAGMGITSINTDSTAAQTLTIGTTGTDFAIVDNGSGDHKFNLPDAGAASRGVVTTGTQTFAGAKTFSTIITGSVSGNAATVTTNANLTGVITSVGNATSIASQTGTGTKFVVDTTPTLVTPILGVATATSINKVAITAPLTSATLTIADGKTATHNATTTFAGTDGKTLTISNNLTLAGTDGKSLTLTNGLTITTNDGTIAFGAASKTLTVNKSIALDGTDSTTMTFPSTSATIARTDAANTFTGAQTFSNAVINTNNAITASGNAATVPITARLNTVTNNSAATLTITMTTASATDGQMTIVRILDFSGVAQTITWVNTENSTQSAPTTSNGSTTLFLTVGFIYNGGTSKWRCIASA